MYFTTIILLQNFSHHSQHKVILHFSNVKNTINHSIQNIKHRTNLPFFFKIVKGQLSHMLEFWVNCPRSVVIISNLSAYFCFLYIFKTMNISCSLLFLKISAVYHSYLFCTYKTSGNMFPHLTLSQTCLNVAHKFSSKSIRFIKLVSCFL